MGTIQPKQSPQRLRAEAAGLRAGFIGNCVVPWRHEHCSATSQKTEDSLAKFLEEEHQNARRKICFWIFVNDP